MKANKNLIRASIIAFVTVAIGAILGSLCSGAMVDKIPSNMYTFWFTDKVVFTRIIDANEIAPGKYRFTGGTAVLTYPEGLAYLCSGWCSPYTLVDFALFSENWLYGTTVAEPNEPPEPNEVDTTLGVICYTVGGKDHLYQDCRYIINKEWRPCMCDASNICLTCTARKVREE